MKRGPVMLLVMIAATAVAQTPAQLPPQAFSLRPQKADGGVLFQCYAPAARVVYLAGDFNGWANNVDGRITNAAFAMSGPDINGVWRKTVKLDAGIYHFKFNINGEGNGWFPPDSIDELDSDKNAILHVDGSGEVIIRSPHDPKWKPRVTGHGALLQCYAPDAHLVYLAGDFNDWGHNRNGLVFDPRFVMNGPDSNGAWRAEIELKPGRHAYQFVIDGDHWIADPNTDEKDEAGHSAIEVK
jgi:1,4-alpha-glucan branching enzyme